MGRRTAWALLLAETILITGLTSLARPAISYAAIGLGANELWIGIVGASYALAPVLVVIQLGRLTDRTGPGVPNSVGCVVVLLASVGLQFWSGDVVLLVVWSAMLGLGQITVILAIQTAVAEMWDDRDRDAAYGWFAFCASLGQLLGPLGLAALPQDGARPLLAPLFLAITLGSGAMTGLAVALIWGVRRPTSGNLRRRPGSFAEAVKVPGLIPAIVTSMTVLATVDLISVFLPSIAVSHGLSPAAVGLLLAARAAASMASRAFMGTLVNRVGRRTLLVVSLAMASVTVGLIAIPMPFPLLIAIMVLAGIGLGYGQPLTLAWLASAASPDTRSTALGVRMLGNRLSQVIIPAAGGVLAAAIGVGAVFWVMAAALAGVAVSSGRSRM